MCNPRVEEAIAERPLGIFYSLFRLTSMAENGGALGEHIGRCAVDLKRPVDRVHRHIVVVRHETNRETRVAKGPSAACVRPVASSSTTIRGRAPNPDQHAAQVDLRTLGLYSGQTGSCAVPKSQRPQVDGEAWSTN